jgi:hypothetical protein
LLRFFPAHSSPAESAARSASAAHAARRFALTLIAAVFLFGSRTGAQFEKTLSATFDGWSHLADGSYELVFGYMNRNATEVEVPLGPANQLEPAPADHGQPTNFLPGRQRAAFRIPVPANFKGKYIWTVTYAGTTQVAIASLDQNYSLDVGDPEPPGVKAGADQTIRLSEAATLSPIVSAPLPPPASTNPDVVARRSAGARITVWWSKFRGPGMVTFGDGEAAAASNPGPTGRENPMGSFRLTCTAPLEASCGTTRARFSVAGTYWLRVVAAERSASNALMKVVVNP